MDERIYRRLVQTATLLGLLWFVWLLYQQFGASSTGERELAAASRYLEDGQSVEALRLYRALLERDDGNSAARYGEALALMQLASQVEQRSAAYAHRSAALAGYDRIIAEETAKGLSERNRSLLGVCHANRGIVRDHLGDHQGALTDYRRALQLEPEVGEGPGLLTRFLRNQAEPPPGIAARADYLERQLELPPEQRQLALPDRDARQRSYTM